MYTLRVPGSLGFLINAVSTRRERLSATLNFLMSYAKLPRES
jgi:hypothetical protein